MHSNEKLFDEFVEHFIIVANINNRRYSNAPLSSADVFAPLILFQFQNQSLLNFFQLPSIHFSITSSRGAHMHDAVTFLS